MPIYEYECEACHHRLEKLQKISDEPLKVCPSCSKPSLNKLVSAAAFRLKGSGWYETDFKTGKKKNVHGVGGTSDGSSGPSTDSSSSGSSTDKSPGKGSKDSGSSSSESKSSSGSSASAAAS
ncbi:MAG: zinc ribbon domain-containing protein [Proteobacteria bacterium]|nr:zinc ribbon domain-containing protein [Pseudomonadota bacterium]